ncbi:hypothetical protein HY837_06740 [archaeon]|nr:hypothetical protein [archaeon]
MIIQLPEEVKQLQKDWFDTSVPKEVQHRLRFACQVFGKKGKRMVWDTVSGGGGTICSHGLEENVYQQIRALQRKELFPKSYDENSKRALENFLSQKGITLEFGGYEETPKLSRKIFSLTKKIYELLPEHHLGHDHLKILKLCGWGGGAAKCSEYDDPVVHMFDFAVKGPIRNYVGLLLHETGHSFDEWVKQYSPELRNELKGLWGELSTSNKGFAIDYLLGEKSRHDYYMSFSSEFLAEFYLIYVSQGERFRGFMKNSSQGSTWEKVYGAYKILFDDKEYN